MRISDWSSDVCSSDLGSGRGEREQRAQLVETDIAVTDEGAEHQRDQPADRQDQFGPDESEIGGHWTPPAWAEPWADSPCAAAAFGLPAARSEEHTSELQSLMRHSYAVFCLQKK